MPLSSSPLLFLSGPKTVCNEHCCCSVLWATGNLFTLTEVHVPSFPIFFHPRFGPPFLMREDRSVSWDQLQQSILSKLYYLMINGAQAQVIHVFVLLPSCDSNRHSLAQQMFRYIYGSSWYVKATKAALWWGYWSMQTAVYTKLWQSKPGHSL